MKSMRIPLYAATGIVVICLILGSLFDFQVSSAIASPDNFFGLLVSVIGPTIGFGGLCFIGGGFIAIGVHQKWKPWVRVLFFLGAAAALVSGIIYAQGEYFGINGFYKKLPDIVAFLIVIPILSGCEFLGYLAFKDTTNRKAWIIFLIIYVILLFVLLGLIPTIKDNMHRPRYREVMQGEVPFHNWWQKCANYQDYINNGSPKDNFKSFPSGHTAEASILLVATTFMPLANPKFKKIQLPLFIGSFLFMALIALARILAAAHYLSDVSMGALLTLVTTVIANEIVIHIKPLHEDEQEQPVQQVEENQ